MTTHHTRATQHTPTKRLGKLMTLAALTVLGAASALTAPAQAIQPQTQ